MKNKTLILSIFIYLVSSCTVVDTELMELLSEIKSQNLELLTEVKSLQAKSDSLVNEIKKSAAKQEELLKKVSELQTELAKVLSQITSLNEKLTSQGADLEAIKAQLADLQKKYEGILVQLEQLQKLSQILAEIEKLKGQLVELDAKYQLVITSLAQNQQAIDALKSQVTTLQTQLALNLEKISQLTSQLGEQGADIEKILDEISELRSQCGEIKSLLEILVSGKNQIPTSGLIAWYPFNGSSNDQWTNKINPLETTAILTTSRSGENASAYQFNGQSFIDFGKNTQLTPKQISVSAWIKAKTIGNEFNTIIRARFYGYFLYLQPNGKAYVNLHDTGTNSFNEVVTSKSVNDDQWHHLVFTFSDKKLSLYLDGVLQQSVSTSFPDIVYGLTGVAIGKDGDADKWYFNGSIDDLAIWNRALTADEVSKIYKGEGF